MKVGNLKQVVTEKNACVMSAFCHLSVLCVETAPEALCLC